MTDKIKNEMKKLAEQLIDNAKLLTEDEKEKFRKRLHKKFDEQKE